MLDGIRFRKVPHASCDVFNVLLHKPSFPEALFLQLDIMYIKQGNYPTTNVTNSTSGSEYVFSIKGFYV